MLSRLSRASLRRTPTEGGTAFQKLLTLVSTFASDRALWRVAMGVTAAMSVLLLTMCFNDLGRSFGDTDDALRLAIVRDLVHGRGWFDQHLSRLQPPAGVFMHWSRLLDGGLALTERLFGELWTRALWPLFWIAPAALGVLAIARRIARNEAKGLAVLTTAALLLIDLPLYVQFHPGRVDHHNVQITLSLLALAGAVVRGAGVRGALGAGLATGLGLAIGLEALPFEAVIGAGIALEFVCDPQGGRRGRAYGLGLAAATTTCFLVQTPPWRWNVSVCDALGLNLLLAVAAAGGGLFAAAHLTATRSWRARLGAVAIVGAGALGLYLALKPACIGGAFAEVDPRLRPLWLDHVGEMQPLGHVLTHNLAQGGGVIRAAFVGVGALFGILCLRPRGRRLDPPLAILAACLLLSVAAGFAAIKMSGYLAWFATPLAGALIAEAFVLSGPSALAISSRALAALAGVCLIILALKAGGVLKGAPSDPPDPCFATSAYAVLAHQPPGVTLGEIDLGSYVLAHTPSSALSAPYHRMAWGVLAAHGALAAPADRAQAAVRALHVDYVLECRAHRKDGDRDGLARDSLQRRLDSGRPPAWLTRVSPPGAPLEVYRVSLPH